MKEKLEKVREIVDNIPTMFAVGLYADAALFNKEALAILDSLIAELDSLGLAEKVRDAINDANNLHEPYCAEALAEAAIEAIKEN